MGNVLIPWNPGGYLAQYPLSPEDRELLFTEIFCSVEWIQRDRGVLTDREAIPRICRRVPERLHPTVEAVFAGWHTHMRPAFDDMEALARELKTSGYAVYLLSNVSKDFYDRSFSRWIPALEVFDGIFVSADVQLLKPSEAIYQAFLENFRLAARECFFIDDSPLNIEGAIRVGMTGFVYRRNTLQLRQALREAGVEIAPA